jgi:hypothetical protein
MASLEWLWGIIFCELPVFLNMENRQIKEGKNVCFFEN